MKILSRFTIISIILIQFSCVSKKRITYFQNDEIDQSLVSNSYKTVFKPDDLLQITISTPSTSAIDIEATKPFNLPAVTFSATVNAAIGQPTQQMYLVNSAGDIDFPVFGTIKIGGLSRDEAIKMFKSKLDPEYIKNPIINIRIANYKISVLGDVRKPGTYFIPNERITVMEAIGLAGDLNISGQRDNIIVQREEDGQKKMYRLDIRSNKIFTSPAYYLQQNDVIYIEPNYASAQSASFNQNTGLFVSITSILISLVTLLTR